MTANTIPVFSSSSLPLVGVPVSDIEVDVKVYMGNKDLFELRCKENGVDIFYVRESKMEAETFIFTLCRYGVEDKIKAKETVGLRCGCGECVPELRYEWEWLGGCLGGIVVLV